MRFILSIELGNDAMQTRHHIARALQTLASKLLRFYTGNPTVGDGETIHDDNGNRVGSWHVEGE